MQKVRKNLLPVLGIAALMAGAYFAGYGVMNAKTRTLVEHIVPQRQNNFNYQFVFPLLRIGYGAARNYLEDTGLEHKLQSYVANAYSNNDAETISVYVTNLLNNRWSGVNADIQYHPGSMMKVLIMIAYYREAQLDPAILDKTLVYSSQMAAAATGLAYSSPSNLVVGKGYTVSDLIADMIKTSDNGAETLLLYNSNEQVLNDIYHDLGTTVPSEVPDYTITPNAYSAFLRVLYNATYLTDADSEAALKLMTQTTFTGALAAGVPNSVPVAHKYGERFDTDANGAITNMELSDCGIVYGTTPYSICVMTKGDADATETSLSAVIRNVSNIVYEYEENSSAN